MLKMASGGKLPDPNSQVHYEKTILLCILDLWVQICNTQQFPTLKSDFYIFVYVTELILVYFMKLTGAC